MIPAERRLPEALPLLERRGYFVVHAPRQTGKLGDWLEIRGPR